MFATAPALVVVQTARGRHGCTPHKSNKRARTPSPRQVYWSSSQPYYAFGLGAASYTRGRRFTRPRGMREYEAWVGQHVAAGSGDPAAQLPLETQVGEGALVR